MRIVFALAAVAVCMNGVAAEYFVATNGCDRADGSVARPWRTIQRAADVAVAGDVVTICGGTYREWVKPANAGREGAPITYQAAKGEKVVVTGADPVTGWTRRPDGLWEAKVRYDSFRGMNPFTDNIFGDWFDPRGGYHLRSWVIQSGKALTTHSVRHFWDQNAHGRPVVNVGAIFVGSRKMPGCGQKREGQTHVCSGLDLSAKESRTLTLRTSSEKLGAVLMVYDNAAPKVQLAKVSLPPTGGWDKFTDVKLTLPDSAANVKELLLQVWFGGHSYKYDAAAKLLQPGHVVLIPGMVTGRIIAAFEQDPNVCVPELVTRPACFYPIETHRDYITLRGISFLNAAPNWGTANGEQVGVVGTNWSRGWVIEDCEVSGSSCDGITLGKFGDEYDNSGPFLYCYYDTIKRAASNGWDRVGYHVVRRCKVSECGQTGIHGSLGAAFSTIEDNEIFHCNWKKPFFGCDQAGIKFLCSVDVTIARNRIHHNGGWAGIWLDWMAQGARVSCNTLWCNPRDLFLEVNHGPILVEGNDCLSSVAVLANSQGIAFVGNRMLGRHAMNNEQRCTPVFKPHTVTLESIDLVPCGSGGHVYVNNILAQDPRFAKETFPSRFEDNWFIPANCWKGDPATGKFTITPPPDSKKPDFKPVDAKRLGKPVFVDQAFPAPTVQDGFGVWPSTPPEDCPFPQSAAFSGVEFTGRHAEYTAADTWYPSWASDGELYSPWTDGVVAWTCADGKEHSLRSWSGKRNATTGHAKIVGDDPLNLKIVDAGLFKSDPHPYEGRYPCGSLVHDGIWYYGTYCLNPLGKREGNEKGYPWVWLGPFVGFRWSTDFGKTWTQTPCTPANPLFGENGLHGEPVKIGCPCFVDFGKNMEHSPDGKAYLVVQGSSDGKNRRYAYNSWINSDQTYLIRVTPSIANMNDASKYEFFAGRGADGQVQWTRDFAKMKPLLEWRDRMGRVSATYNPALRKYFMCVTDGRTTISKYNTYILEADELVGPWRLVTYMRDFGEQAYFVNIPSKFIDGRDGQTMWLCYASNWWRRKDANLKSIPSGSRYGMCLQEFRLIALGGHSK